MQRVGEIKIERYVSGIVRYVSGIERVDGCHRDIYERDKER
jgi:hypothetical protein